MRRDPKAYLWDAAAGSTAIQRFISGQSYDDYLADEMQAAPSTSRFRVRTWANKASLGNRKSDSSRVWPEYWHLNEGERTLE